MIKGIDVTLFVKNKVGKDALNNPIYEETETVVNNVLVAPSISTDINDITNLVGKQTKFTLGIPKGDTHVWENQKVKFNLNGREYVCKTYGFTIEGIENLVPTRWHKKVMCELYE